MLIHEPQVIGQDARFSWHAAARDARLGVREIETRHRWSGGPWSEWSVQRSATVSAPSGRHEFAVEARSGLAEGEVVRREITFALPHHPLRHPLVRYLGGLGLLLVGGLAYTMRRRQRHHDL